MSAALGLALLSLAIWLYLIAARGRFWLPRLAPALPEPARWPSVVALVPARDEAASVGAAIVSLLGQEYPGNFSVLLIDDGSSDGTPTLARAAAAAAGAAHRFDLVAARALPAGWTGKLWALAEGLRRLEESGAEPELLLFTDADIAHRRGNLARLVAWLEAGRLDLVSLMVRLRCESVAERFLIPAFVFFFAMLYPFAWVGDARRRTAAAAGGCMLVRAAAYRRAGGAAALRGELIDDCALARRIKAAGPIALALSADTRSLRPYPRVADVWAMVARTAYAQLDRQPWLLLVTTLGLGVTFLAPPVLLAAGGAAAWVGLAAWAAMALCYAPMLRFHGVALWWAPALPAVALVYLGATLDSARRHWLGRGGAWKGRVEWQSQR